MVTTRGMAMGTGPKVKPPPAKPSEAEKAAKAARIKAKREEKKAERAATKALNDAKKAAAKADKDAEKAAAKAKKDAEKAAKAANTKNSAKRTVAAKTKATKAIKVTKAAKVTKAVKTTKTTKKAKAANKRARAATVEAPANQHDEDEDEDEEEDKGDHHEPQAKRRKIANPAHERLYGAIGPPKPRPAFEIGKWDYMRKTDIPGAVVNKDNRSLPHIWIGGSAPQPRWVVTQSETIGAPRKQYTSNTKSTRREIGDLQWTFEEGDFQKWTGLEYPALYEIAYLCLESTLVDTEIREQIYDSLAEGLLPKDVTIGNTWYPALPPVPITRYFTAGSSRQTSRKSSNAVTGFYFNDYQRPNMAVRPYIDRHVPPPPRAAAANIYDRPRLENWPAAPRSASPDVESERGSEESQSVKSRNPSVTEEAMDRNEEGVYSEPTTPTSLMNEQNNEQDGELDSDQEGEESQSAGSRRASVSGESDLEQDQEGTYSEPTTPPPLEDIEKTAQTDTISEDGSIFGDGNDYDNDVRAEPNSARDSQEPNSPFSGSGSDSEVSASSKTSEPRKFKAADDNSAQSTNSLYPVSHDGHDGLFSPGQIDRYYSERNTVFEQERLGGLEHHEALERKSQAQLSSNPGKERLTSIDARLLQEAKEKNHEMRELTESSKRMRAESPSTRSPPATRRKTAAETRVDETMSFVGQEKRDEMRAAAAEKVSDRPPVALLKKTTGTRAGARQADAPSPEILPNLQDGFLEQTKAYLNDPIQRRKHFPDPIAVRRARVWAGEELVGHEIKPTVDATLPPWAEIHRPFSQWKDPIGITPAPAARTKVSRSKKRNKGQGKRRPKPASAKEQSISSARWSSFN
ncbi:uncharacterized protein N7479_007719 [Penicillium vulpinum]|uniref:Uncharacterized protein n=1 Tax=Penicillium vulpinum TaxID=29845 RepID=A0A1V6SAL7_9EURO|nr:uncharacterized protein N7479_007719 [Penicillium vulpinum]KAJ5960569.1 hypothetical protein N7479_007719 [Penicillium vulpinum]OQE10810.1 hypothetical protein PENVUL_c003G06057 [Penicillium vulpinum]